VFKVELSKKKELKKHQDPALKIALNNNDLGMAVLYGGDESLRKTIAQNILNQKPNNKDLRKLNNKGLREIIIWEEESLKKRAARKLMRQDPSKEDLILIIEEVKCLKLKEEVARRIMSQEEIDIRALCVVILKLESLREEAAQRIMSQEEIDIRALCVVILKVPSLRRKAWLKLLKNIDEEKKLFFISMLV